MNGLWAERLGWTFVHFLWQGAVIGAVAAGLLVWLSRRGPEVRYGIGVLALVASLLAPVVTFATFATLGVDGGSLVIVGASGPLEGIGVSTGVPLSRLLPGLAWFWLLGAAAMQVRTLVLMGRARRLVTRGTSAPSAEWADRFERLRVRVGVRPAVRLLRSARVAGPVVIGWLRPVILVPAEVFSGMPSRQLSAVLAHELAHVRRHDFLVNLLQAVAEALLFFHPVVWWLSARVREEREFCCDDLVLRTGGDRAQFARGLAALESLTSGATIAPAVAAHGGSLMKRIERLVHPKPHASPRGVSAGVPLVVLGALIGLVPAAGGGSDGLGDAPAAKPAPAVAKRDAETTIASLKMVMSRLTVEERHAVIKLRELGMSDAELLEALSRTGSGDVVGGVLAKLQARHEARVAEEGDKPKRAKEAGIEERAAQVRAKLAAAVAAGELTEAEANEHLEEWHDGMLTKLREKRRHLEKLHAEKLHAEKLHAEMLRREKLPEQERAAQAHERLEQALKKIAHAVEAGAISEAEAAAKVKALKEKMRRR